MTYSCSDFTDDILNALQVDTDASVDSASDVEIDILANIAIDRIKETRQLVFDLWSFIENDATKTTSEVISRFFELRERVRELQR